MMIKAETPKPEGQRVGPFLISPAARWKGRLAQGRSTSAVFVITSDSPQPLRIIRAATEGQAFTAKLETLEAGKRWMVTASSAARLQPGALAETLVVTTDSREFPELKIQLNATVDAAVVATPVRVDFGVLPISTPDYDASRVGKFIFIRQTAGGGLKIKKVSSTLPFIKTEVKETSEGQAYQMLITFDRDKLTAGTYTGKVMLEVNNPDTPVLEISISLRAQ